MILVFTVGFLVSVVSYLETIYVLVVRKIVMGEDFA